MSAQTPPLSSMVVSVCPAIFRSTLTSLIFRASFALSPSTTTPWLSNAVTAPIPNLIITGSIAKHAPTILTSTSPQPSVRAAQEEDITMLSLRPASVPTAHSGTAIIASSAIFLSTGTMLRRNARAARPTTSTT